MNCNTEAEYANKDRLLAFIKARVTSNDDAWDILQDTYVKFEECCQQNRQCQYPKAYLFKMAQNAIADFFTKKRVEQNAQTEAKELFDAENSDPVDHKLTECNIHECTFRFLQDVSPANREAFIKSDMENVSQKQLAEELGVPPSTLKSRVQRTRLYLRAAFTECFKNR